MNPYLHFVSEFARIAREGRKCPAGGPAPPPHPSPRRDAPLAILFSPHPDDESIVGGLALRLSRECQWNVLNAAITLGGKRERRAKRLKELRGACRYLGFGLWLPAPGGLEKVSAVTRVSDPRLWAEHVALIAGLLRKRRPQAVFFPNDLDWHSAHIGAHWLVMDALARVEGLSCYLVETEYWGQMAWPNLLVEYSVKDVADLVAAVSFHAGEIKRNPYHLRLPAWMHDNVRRGAERVGGQGRPAPAFDFAQLFRLRRWNSGRMEACCEGGRVLPASTSPDVIFSP
ncbi:MAG: PIG-L family deacetylase [Verrucomicrobiota bacterium]